MSGFSSSLFSVSLLASAQLFIRLKTVRWRTGNSAPAVNGSDISENYANSFDKELNTVVFRIRLAEELLVPLAVFSGCSSAQARKLSFGTHVRFFFYPQTRSILLFSTLSSRKRSYQEVLLKSWSD